MESAFGIDHGEVSKGLPSAVRNGGGGQAGSFMRLKNSHGKAAAKLKGDGFSVSHARKANIEAGKTFKSAVNDIQDSARVNQAVKGNAARRMRAELLNEDIASRKAGWKSGKTSGLKTGYRGRVSNKMKELP